MVSARLFTSSGESSGTLELPAGLFEAPCHEHVVYEAVKAYLASQRRGTHSTKSRGEVRGGGKKPWRQKGTGRARAGSSRSSLWRHGSIAHGPKPRDYAYEIPRKSLRGALRSALAARFQEDKMTVVDEFNLAEPKTKAFSAALKKLDVGKTVLVVDEKVSRNLALSARNVPGCDLLRQHKLHPYDVLSHERLLISESALKRLQESLR